MHSLKVITVFNIQQEFTLFIPFALLSPSQQLHTEGGKIFSCLHMELHRFVSNMVVQQLNNSALDCCQCYLFISAMGFLEIWHNKTQHCQFYYAEESFLPSCPMPDEFLSLYSFLLADLKAPPVHPVDEQPRLAQVSWFSHKRSGLCY